MKFNTIYLLALMAGGSLATQPEQQQQQVLMHPMSSLQKESKLHGRYLHITDIHMDHHYIPNATIKSNCHREPKKHKNRKRKQGLLAGYWGAPNTDCDAPPRLVHHSIQYIANEWKDKIDFVLWTGDNARHDGDALITRTKKEIVGYNQKVTDLLKHAFKLDSNRTIPIVPCIGNNDVHPHNQFRDMKHNSQLLEFSEIWKEHIPATEMKSFKRGGYYAVDVVPGLRVLSLNSLYFFGSNDVVTSCADAFGPGARHMRWLRKQLKHARKENVKVILIGHVPPTVKTFKDSCLDGYIKLSTKFSDVISAHMYGHTNMDHFQILSRRFGSGAKSLEFDVEEQDNEGYSDEYDSEDDDDEEEEEKENSISITQDNARFIKTIKKQYKEVTKVRQTHDLVVIHVAPPMIPLFYPTFRVNEYETNNNSPEFGNWLKYTQWYTNLTHWNEARHPITGKRLKPEFEIEYATDTTYKMKDLTPNSWLDLAERLSDKNNKKTLWKTYLDNMFVQTNNLWYDQSIPAEKNKGWKHWLIKLVEDFLHI